jgi:hypothetical protein
MATPEEIRKKNLEESNEALAESINLSAKLTDEMSFVLKIFKEKGTLDKQSLDLTKQALSLTKSLSSEYKSLNDVAKDIQKNEKAQTDIKRQIQALNNQGGQSLKDELKMLNIKEESLAKAQSKIAKMESDKRLGKKIDEEAYQQAQQTIVKKQEQLNIAKEILTPEAQQVMFLEDTNELLEKNNEYLSEQARRQDNLAKSQSLFTSLIGGTTNALNKLGFGNLAKKIGLEDAKKKAEEMTYALTDGGKKSLGFFGKMKVAVASFGVALKSALGPIALLTGAISLISSGMRKFKENAAEGLEYLKKVSQQSVDLSRSLGISQEKANGVAASARAIGGAMGMTTDMAMGSASAIYGAMSGVEKVSDGTLKTFMKLNVFAGMSADTLNEMHRMAKLTGQDAGVMANKMADSAKSSIMAYKVNISQKEVMIGVSKLSNEMKLNFGGSAEALTKSFVKAKSLGFELEKVKGISQSLLNIEDSIAAEMEAELLTGKDLNLEKAREAALNHDADTLMEEIAKNYGSVAEFQKMNVIQQEAAAKAIGMTSDELANVLAGSKANKSENQQLLDTQKQGVAAMASMVSLQEKINAREEKEAAMKAKSAANMEKMNEFMHKMAMIFGPILETVFDEIFKIVEPLFGKLEKGADGMINMAKPVEKIKGFFASIKQTLNDMKEPLKEFFTGLKNIATVVGPILLNIFKGVGKVVLFLVSSVSNFFKLFQGGNQQIDKTKALIGGLVLGLYAAVKVMKLFNKELTTGNALQKIGQTLMKGAQKLIGGTIKLLIGERGQRIANVMLQRKSNTLEKAGNAIKKFGNKLLDGTKKLLFKNVATQKLSNMVTMAGNAIKRIGMGIQKGLNALQQKGILGVLKDLMGRIFSMAVTAGKAVAGIPFVGPVLAAAAIASAIAGGMMLYNKFKSQPGDDVMSEGGYGKRTLFGPEGAIRLNDKDTVIAGTDLFGKRKSSASTTSSNDNSALVAEMQAIKNVLQAILSKEGGVFIDGNKVGSTLALASYKTQ